MDKITDVHLVELGKSEFIRPLRMKYKQDGHDKVWDLSLCHDCVSVVIFNTTRKKLVLVRQFRPVVYLTSVRKKLSAEVKAGDALDAASTPADEGMTLELCAGIVDKPDRSAQQIAREEVLEECGYDVGLDALQQVQTCLASVGISGEQATLFYVEVTDSQRRKDAGGGVSEEGEMIEVVEMSVQEARELVGSEDVRTSPLTLCGIFWFLANKA